MSDLVPTTDTILNMFPATGIVTFTGRRSDPSRWSEQLVGYAIAVKHVERIIEPTDGGADFWEYEARIEPVVLDEGTPVTLSDYIKDRPLVQEWSVIPA